MRAIVHIVRKDLRQAWPYGAAALAVLLLNTANFARVLASRGTEQAAALGVQVPLDWLLVIAWALFYGIVLLGDTVPGTRQHWISRPLRWQSLLAAKLLLLPLFGVPVAIAHWIQLSLRGFPLSEHAGPVAANAFWLVFAGLLPIATLASLCRNLQQLALWVLLLAPGVLGLQYWDSALPVAVQGAVNDVTVAGAVLGCLAILVWQYATRRTWPARIATVVLVAVLATLPHWPASLWRPLLHTVENPASLALLPPFQWDGEQLNIPIKAANLAPKSVIRRTDWVIRASVPEAATTDIRTGDSNEFQSDGALWISTPSGFLVAHGSELLDVEITGFFTVFSAPRYDVIPLQGERFVPGIGRCQNWADKMQIVDCQSVLGAANRLEISPIRAPGERLRSNITPLASSKEQPWLGLVPQLHPIALLNGDMPIRWDEQPAHIFLHTRAPIAHIQRSLQLRGIRLTDLRPNPVPPPARPAAPNPLEEAFAPPPPKPTSPTADQFFPYPPAAPPPAEMPFYPLKAPK